MAVKRFVNFTLVAALLLSACGGGEMSLAEYVERVDAIFERGIQQYEALVTSPQGLVLIVGQGSHLGFDDQGAQLTDFTPQDLHVALERVAEIQAGALEAAHAIEPPEQIADFHSLYFRELPIAELVVRRTNNRRVSPALDAPGFDLLLEARVKCAFVGGHCQMTPRPRRYAGAISATHH